MESAILSISPILDPMAPISESPGVGGQALLNEKENKRRRPASPKSEDEAAEEDSDSDTNLHRIDSLA